MNRAEKVKELLQKTYGEQADDSDLSRMDERILNDASTSMKQALAANQRIYAFSKWRKIMRTKMVKLATAAAVFIAAFLLITLDRSASTAWSVQQTIAAIKELNTLHIEGKAYWGPDSDPELVNFNFWVQFPNEDSELLKMRFECYKRIIIVQGETAYECWPKEKVAKIINGPDIPELQAWYKGAEFSPWLTGKMLWILKQLSDDWTEVVQFDPSTGKKQILVTCSYAPSDTSYSIVVDAESKLVETARMWKKGQPCVDAHAFTYNQENPPGAFELPEDYNIVDEKGIQESQALSERALQLYEEKKYAKAIAVYQQVYEKFPDKNIAEEALMMIGVCYDWLGQPEKAIEAYEKAINEYPNLKGWIETTWFYLGCAYMDIGEKEKALDAFEKCLAAGEGVREPEQFPLKDARECIAKIKAEQDSQPRP